MKSTLRFSLSKGFGESVLLKKTERPFCDRILIRATNWLGDSIMSLPAILSMKQHCPAVKRVLFVEKKLEKFWQAFDLFEQIIPFSKPDGIAAELQMLRRLKRLARKGKWTQAVSFPPSARSYLQCRLLGAEKVYSFHPLCGWQYPENISNSHEAGLYYKLFSSFLPAGTLDLPHSIPYPFKIKDQYQQLLRDKKKSRLFALFPGAAFGPAKCYPAEQWAAVLNGLHKKDPEAHFILLGSPTESEACRSIRQRLERKEKADILAGKLSLTDTLSLFPFFDLILTHDSGPMHVAGYFNFPLLALFGSTSLTKTAPAGKKSHIIQNILPCSPCKKPFCPADRFRCLPGIPPQFIIERIEEIVSC